MATAAHVVTTRTAQLSKIWLEHEFFSNPRQFTGLGDKDIEELGENIKSEGMLDPVTVQKVLLDNGEIIDLAIDGQRRVKAAQEFLPKNAEIPVVDLTADPIKLTPELGDQLVNKALTSLRREGLSSYELLAVAIRKKAAGQTLEEIGNAIDMSKTWISRMLTAWTNASEKLKLAWRKGDVTDEQFKDLAEVKDQTKQVDNLGAVLEARKGGDKSEARVLAKETKETARAQKAADKVTQDARDRDKPKVTNGVNKPTVPRAVSGPQGQLFASEKEADESLTKKPEAAKPVTKMISRLALEELVAMADKRPPTADYVKGLMDCARYALSLMEPEKFAKAWHQYVARIQGVRPAKKLKAAKPAKARKPAKAAKKKGKR